MGCVSDEGERNKDRFEDHKYDGYDSECKDGCQDECPGASRTDCVNERCECFYDGDEFRTEEEYEPDREPYVQPEQEMAPNGVPSDNEGKEREPYAMPEEEENIVEPPKQMLWNHNQNLFLKNLQAQKTILVL